MLYLLLDPYQIKLLSVKKSLLGQYESTFYQKQLQTKILERGTIANVDVITSALKEAIITITANNTKEKDITLILPQDSFVFMHTDMPVDIAPTILNSYLKEKVRTQLTINTDDYSFDYLLQENEGKKKILFYGIDNKLVNTFKEPFQLLDMNVVAIVPESLAYFKLFEKTLRKDKKENIFYVSYEADRLRGYVYDSFGLLDKESWIYDIKKDEAVAEVLKQKAIDYELQGKKLNRLILSGKESDTVRQDTFTKQVGVWTNPLKRIIPNFYQEYVKLLTGTSDKSLPVLEYDACIGAFIFSIENKNFSLLKKTNKSISTIKTSTNATKRELPIKPILTFLGSFVLAFLVLFFISKSNLSQFSFAFLQRATPTPTLEPTTPPPTVTPTPSVAREDIKIKVLNGSGVVGKATEVKDLLKEKGYEQILTGNADNFDYETTEIQIKKDKMKELQSVIENDLEDNVSSPKFTTLDENEASDIVIIFGTDFK